MRGSLKQQAAVPSFAWTSSKFSGADRRRFGSQLSKYGSSAALYSHIHPSSANDDEFSTNNFCGGDPSFILNEGTPTSNGGRRVSDSSTSLFHQSFHTGLRLHRGRDANSNLSSEEPANRNTNGVKAGLTEASVPEEKLSISQPPHLSSKSQPTHTDRMRGCSRSRLRATSAKRQAVGDEVDHDDDPQDEDDDFDPGGEGGGRSTRRANQSISKIGSEEEDLCEIRSLTDNRRHIPRRRSSDDTPCTTRRNGHGSRKMSNSLSSISTPSELTQAWTGTRMMRNHYGGAYPKNRAGDAGPARTHYNSNSTRNEVESTNRSSRKTEGSQPTYSVDDDEMGKLSSHHRGGYYRAHGGQTPRIPSTWQYDGSKQSAGPHYVWSEQLVMERRRRSESRRSEESYLSAPSSGEGESPVRRIFISRGADTGNNSTASPRSMNLSSHLEMPDETCTVRDSRRQQPKLSCGAIPIPPNTKFVTFASTRSPSLGIPAARLHVKFDPEFWQEYPTQESAVLIEMHQAFLSLYPHVGDRRQLCIIGLRDVEESLKYCGPGLLEVERCLHRWLVFPPRFKPLPENITTSGGLPLPIVCSLLEPGVPSFSVQVNLGNGSNVVPYISDCYDKFDKEDDFIQAWLFLIRSGVAALLSAAQNASSDTILKPVIASLCCRNFVHYIFITLKREFGRVGGCLVTIFPLTGKLYWNSPRDRRRLLHVSHAVAAWIRTESFVK